MIGSPRMFCQFDAHKSPQEVSRDTCGHLQYVCVPWTYEFQPNLGSKKVLWVMIGSPRMFCQFDAHKVSEMWDFLQRMEGTLGLCTAG